MLKVGLINSFYSTNLTSASKSVDKVVSNIKHTDASSLNALSSYAKAVVSFGAKKIVKPEVSVQLLQEKLNNLDIDYDEKEKLGAYFDKVDDNDKEALSFIDRVFSEPKLYGNKMITSSINEVLDTANFKVTNKVVDKYLSSPKFYDNKWFQALFADGIEIVSTEDRFKLFDKFTDKSALYRNKALKQQIGTIIQSVDTEDNYKLADKLLSTKSWYKNTQIVEDFYMIIDTFTEEDVINFYGLEDEADDSITHLGKGALFETVEAELPVEEEVQIQPDVEIQDVQVEEEIPAEELVVEEESVVEEKPKSPVVEPKDAEAIKRRAEQKAESINERMLSCGFTFDVDDLKEALAEPTPSKDDSPYQRLMAEGKSYYTNGKKLEDME